MTWKDRLLYWHRGYTKNEYEPERINYGRNRTAPRDATMSSGSKLSGN
jgi:hypothetical protein